MRLTDFFAGDRKISDRESAPKQVPASKSALVNRQIRSLTPGQTIQGEVVSRNGSEVQVRMTNDVVLNARLDQNMNLEVGKNMTFEVRNNGRALTLSPLFANMATDPNALKALEMASLPINETTVGMTRLMMEAGLSIDRNSMQQTFREINQYPDTDMSNIIDLHKLGLPVTDENVAQIESYKNLTYQLVTGMNEVMEALPEALTHMVQNGNVEGAAALFGELLELTGGELETMEAVLQQEAGNPEETAAAVEATDQGSTSAAEGNLLQEEGNLMQEKGGILSGENAAASANIQETVTGENAEAMGKMAKGSLPLPEGAQPQEKAAGQVQTDALEQQTRAKEGVLGDRPLFQNLAGELSEISLKYTGETYQGGNNAADLLQFAGQLLNKGIARHDTSLLHDLLGSGRLQKTLEAGMERLLTITPKEVGKGRQVEELYHRFDRQLKGITQALEDAGQTSTRAYQATTNLTQNVDFLHQLNQMYTYVQLPLKFQQGNAHGDLYVYTNKRSLAASDGKVSALLHLDMEHLGPVDVYVAMQDQKVSTSFYVQDDDMLAFISAHLDLLTDRLQKRGYDCKCKMQVRNSGEDENEQENGDVIRTLLANEGRMTLAQYAFDVRA
ncbi:MAG: flagellar hook-length control protein FliK [Candidatus Gastranaerophilales bacterium]|nr:flagellar hook-length control protein FliK [Candidatus Gastranaerophilales bacterium]